MMLGSEIDDEEMIVSESENSNDSWTTEEFSSEFIMKYGSRLMDPHYYEYRMLYIFVCLVCAGDGKGRRILMGHFCFAFLWWFFFSFFLFAYYPKAFWCRGE